METKKTFWLLTKKAAIIGLVIVGPLALPLVWFNPEFSVKAKVWISLAAVALTLILWPLTERSLKLLETQLAAMRNL